MIDDRGNIHNPTRWQALEAAEPSVALDSGQTQYPGTVRVDIGTTGMMFQDSVPVMQEQRTSQHFSTAELLGDTILGSARNGGWPARGDIKSTSVVQTEHGEMTVRSAVDVGLLKQNADGSYADITADDIAARDALANQANQQSTEDSPQLSERTVAAETFFTDALPTGVSDAVVNSMIEAAIGNRTVGFDANKLSGHTEGVISPDQWRNTVGAVVAGYQAQVDSIVAKHGIDVHDFYDWIRTNAQSDMRLAMVHTYHGKDTSHWKSLVNKYISKSGVTVDSATLTKDGHKVVTKKGVDYVTIGGMEMTVQQAVRSRLLR
jgi:cell wall-associated NlpC family hydrolase